jgi:hypothetical protein
MWIPTRDKRRNIQEDGILHGHLHEDLKSYIAELYITFVEIEENPTNFSKQKY